MVALVLREAYRARTGETVMGPKGLKERREQESGRIGVVGRLWFAGKEKRASLPIPEINP